MTASDQPREGERIAKLLARAGIASRREVERMIADGRVKLNDEVLTTPATVLKSLKGVTVDDKPVKAAEPTRIFVFHKPSGLITAERDPAGRPTIYTALRNALPKDAGRVMPNFVAAAPRRARCASKSTGAASLTAIVSNAPSPH